jgi:ribonuclease P/MRP protein subunit RPP40
LDTGIVPKCWKKANVSPIFKKGPKSEPGNYRPISLTSIIGKLLESIIRDHIVNYLESNNLINYSQFGFRRRRSCLTNLLDFFDKITIEYDKTKSLDLIYLDFRKAFDTVPHNRLLIKLEALGINGNILTWIKEWLSERTQRVYINGHYSEYKAVTSGIAQGSVLGPVLFLIYINDIDIGIKSYISKFADDTKLMSSCLTTNHYEKIQSDLDKLKNWSNTWQLKFNESKCKVLHVGPKNQHNNYNINSIPLKACEQETDLGVVISNSLKPEGHIAKVSKTCNKLIGLIIRSFTFKSEYVILKLYKTLIRPHLDYCAPLWSPYYGKDIIKLEKIQRRVTKLVPGLGVLTYEERLKRLNLHSLERRRKRSDIIELYKMINNLVHVDLNKYLEYSVSNTRGNNLKFKKLNPKSNIRKYSYFCRIVGLWNALPDSIVSCGNITSFKISLDKHMDTNELNPYYV